MGNKLSTLIVLGGTLLGVAYLTSCSGMMASRVVPLSNPSRAAELKYNAAWSHPGNKTSGNSFTLRYDRAGKAQAMVGAASAGTYQVGSGGGLLKVDDLGTEGGLEHVLLLASQMPTDGRVVTGNNWSSALPASGKDTQPSFEFQFEQKVLSANKSGVKVHQVASRRLAANTWSRSHGGGVGTLASGWKVFAEGDWVLDGSGSVESGQLKMIPPVTSDELNAATATATVSVTRAP
jgi:hypothetical protein